MIKPTTYMNNSGNAVRHVVQYFKLALEDIIIIYDDYNLPFGTIRFRFSGSDGGHNGIKSIIYQLNSEQFSRMRFGIGNQFDDSVSFVLSDFNRQEEKELDRLLSISGEAIGEWIKNGIESAMNKYNKYYL